MFTIENIENPSFIEDSKSEEASLFEENYALSKKDIFPVYKYQNSVNDFLNTKENLSIEDVQNALAQPFFEKNMEEIETKEKTFLSAQKNSLFNIVNYKKRRRFSIGYKKNKHLSSDFDNLQRKIQVHFLTFVIDYSNDALGKEFKYYKDSFKNINKKNKITVNYDYVSKLKTLSIKDILKFDISEKYTKHKKSYNKDLLEEIEGKSIWLSKLFEMNYLDLFKIYYNKEKTTNKKNEEREEIRTTKTKEPKYFYDLLEKYKNLRNNLAKTVKEVYFSENDNKNGSPFSTKAIFK